MVNFYENQRQTPQTSGLRSPPTAAFNLGSSAEKDFLLIQERSGRHGFTTVFAMARVPHPDVVEETKATLQAAAVLLPIVQAAEGEGGVVVENTFLTVKENVANSPSRKTEGGEAEEDIAVLEKQQKKLALKKLALDGKMYTMSEFIEHYGKRHVALCRAAGAWDAAKRVCTYCGTWKRIYGNGFDGQYHTFPSLLAAMNGRLLAAGRVWQQPGNRTVNLEHLPPQQRWTLFEQLPQECEHFDRVCESCHGRLCTHHLHALCTRGTCSFCHCTRAVWVTQWLAGPYGVMQQQVAVNLPA
eukprot:s2743_g13.t1